MKVAKQINIIKKLIITMVSWSLLLTPTANALAQQEEKSSETVVATQNESVKDAPSQAVTHNPDYCHIDGTAQKCDGGQVYNCHLKSCVSKDDNYNYNREYMNCGANTKCQEDLKSDAELFTNHEVSGKGLESKDDVYRYLSAAANIGYGCVLLGAGSCPTDFGLKLAAVIIMATTLMGLLGDNYKKKFKQYKKELEKLDETDEKGWNHQLQKTALTTEIRMLKGMEDAAKEKMKHHQRTQTLITIVGAIAAICAAMSWAGCTVTNPCTYWTIGLAAVAFAMEMQANNIAKKARDKAKKSRQKAEEILAKLESRYNNQYNPGSTQNAAIATMNNSVNTSSNNKGMEQSDTPSVAIKSEKLKTIPDLDVNMGSLGKNAESFANAIGLQEISDGYSKTKKEGNMEYLNEAIDKNAAKVSKAARRVMELAAKSKTADPKVKSAANAFLDPTSDSSQKFLGETFANNTSPIGLALSYRKAGGSDASKDLDNNTSTTPSAQNTGIAYDATSKDYLNKIKSQLADFESMLDDDTGVMAMSNFGDPTVNSDAVNQLNNGQENKSKDETIHKDSGVSLWKIISNRYNEIKLKKTLE